MYNPSYSQICNHDRLERINDNFVRCMQCGLSMISQKELVTNKGRREFTKENKNFKNFERNFTNVLEEMEINKPVYDYYTDRLKANKIIVNRQVQFSSNPAKYEVKINDALHYLKSKNYWRILMRFI